MEEAPAVFRAALVDWSAGDDPPEWMPGKLRSEGILYRVVRSVTREALARNVPDVQAVVAGGDVPVMTAENMDAIPGLVAIVKPGSGVDDIDVRAATERGIVVANTPEAVTESVSDHAIALLLAAVRRIPQQDRLVKQGVWDRAAARPGTHLRGATLGLIGFGRVGRDVARKLAGFDMTLLVHDPFAERSVIEAAGGTPVVLEELLARADLVSIHCPLTEATRGLIGERELRLMRPTAVLVNTSRGAVVEEEALALALQSGWIAGAALDVLRQEPPGRDNPLLGCENVILSPHLASMSDLFPGAIWEAVYQTLVDLAAHRRPRSLVNQPPTPRWPLS
ncbi:MAG: phosphoglycerate dehydrogenase [Anaerolineae bacterium]